MIAKAQKFVVKDKYGPLRDGESDRARLWGMELAQAMEADRGALMERSQGADGRGTRPGTGRVQAAAFVANRSEHRS